MSSRRRMPPENPETARVAASASAERIEQFSDAAEGTRLREPAESGEQHEVLPGGECLVDRVELTHEADALAHRGGMVPHVDAVDARRPSSRSVSVARQRTAVVLPAPFGPSSPCTEPAAIVRSNPSRACVAP